MVALPNHWYLDELVLASALIDQRVMWLGDEWNLCHYSGDRFTLRKDQAWFLHLNGMTPHAHRLAYLRNWTLARREYCGVDAHRQVEGVRNCGGHRCGDRFESAHIFAEFLVPGGFRMAEAQKWRFRIELQNQTMVKDTAGSGRQSRARDYGRRSRWNMESELHSTAESTSSLLGSWDRTNASGILIASAAATQSSSWMHWLHADGSSTIQRNGFGIVTIDRTTLSDHADRPSN